MIQLKRRMLCVCLVVAPVASAAQDLDVNLSRGGDDLRSEVRGAMSLVGLLDSDDSTPQALLAAAQADYGRIVSALYGNGRFGPVVSITIDGREAANISPFDAPASIERIAVDIEPGPWFKFGRAEIAPLAQGTEIPETFRVGARAGTAPIREATEAGIRGWRETGHAKAELASQQITADHPAQELDVVLRLAPGPRLRFGDIVVTGNEGVRRTRIREIAGIPQGEVFDPEEITQAERRLRQTGVFSSVAISRSRYPERGRVAGPCLAGGRAETAPLRLWRRTVDPGWRQDQRLLAASQPVSGGGAAAGRRRSVGHRHGWRGNRLQAEPDIRAARHLYAGYRVLPDRDHRTAERARFQQQPGQHFVGADASVFR